MQTVHPRVNRRARGIISSLSALCLLAPLGSPAQEHLTHRDVQQLIANLNSDAKDFRKPFRQALESAAGHNASQTKENLALAERLNRETLAMLKDYEHGRGTGTGFRTVAGTVGQLDRVIHQLRLEANATDHWELVQGDLTALGPSFNLPALAQISTPPTAP